MSHFSKLSTHITDRELLIQALTALGYPILPERTTIIGFRGEETQVDLCFQVPGETYEIGFLLKGDRYQIVADWWGLSRVDPKSFQNQLAQKYAYLASIQSLTRQGFVIAREETSENGEIKLILRRMVE